MERHVRESREEGLVCAGSFQDLWEDSAGSSYVSLLSTYGGSAISCSLVWKPKLSGTSGEPHSWHFSLEPGSCDGVRDQPPCTGQSGDISSGARPSGWKQGAQVGQGWGEKGEKPWREK